MKKKPQRKVKVSFVLTISATKTRIPQKLLANTIREAACDAVFDLGIDVARSEFTLARVGAMQLEELGEDRR